ncbi:MAG: hypothetical protein WCJ76_17480, partial [Comamonadaceae bacterium]
SVGAEFLLFRGKCQIHNLFSNQFGKFRHCERSAAIQKVMDRHGLRPRDDEKRHPVFLARSFDYVCPGGDTPNS